MLPRHVPVINYRPRSASSPLIRQASTLVVCLLWSRTRWRSIFWCNIERQSEFETTAKPNRGLQFGPVKQGTKVHTCKIACREVAYKPHKKRAFPSKNLKCKPCREVSRSIDQSPSNHMAMSSGWYYQLSPHQTRTKNLRIGKKLQVEIHQGFKLGLMLANSMNPLAFSY